MSVEPRDTELRGMVPRRLMEMLDAVSQAKGHQSRFDWLVPLLEAEVEREIHAATVLLRIANINPLATERRGRDSDK